MRFAQYVRKTILKSFQQEGSIPRGIVKIEVYFSIPFAIFPTFGYIISHIHIG